MLKYQMLIITSLLLINLSQIPIGRSTNLQTSNMMDVQFSFLYHTPIEIMNDTSMLDLVLKENLEGDGTVEDPYIIDGWSIDANKGSYCIRIFNMSYSLIIKNSIFMNTSTDSYSILNAMPSMDLYGNYDLRIINITSVYSGLGIRALENDNIRIINSTFHTLDNGIYLRDSSNSTVASNTFSNISGYGLYSSYDDTTSINNNMINVTSPLYMSRSNNAIVSNNLIEEGGGIIIENSNFLMIKDNTVNSSSGTGYRFTSMHDSTLANNLASKCNIGFYLWNSDRNIITNITSVNCDNNGIQMFYSDGCILESGKINSNNNGIYMSNSNDNRINSNSIRFNKNEGIRGVNSNRCRIDSNFISHGLDSGISFINSYGINISNNHLESNNIHGVQLVNVRYSIIKDNLIIRHQDALNLDRTRYNLIINNFIKEPINGVYVFSSIEDNVQNNTIDSCSNHGIVLSETTNIVIRNNSIQKNRYYGLYVFNAIDTVSINNAFIENNGVGSILNVSRVQASCVNSPTIFNDSSRGNYWRDHVSPDMDDDGFVDTPYPIPTEQYDMRPLSFPPFKIVPGPVIDPSGLSFRGTISINYSRPDRDGGSPILLYRIYRKEGGTFIPYMDMNPTLHIFIDKDVINGRRYQYRISAINVIGEGLLSPIISVISDSTPPSIVITKPLNNSIISTDHLVVSWEISGDQWEEAPPLLDILLDGMTLQKGLMGSSYKIVDISEGIHTITLDSYDFSDNHNQTSITILVDTIPPDISILFPINGSYYNRTEIEVSFEYSEDGSGLRYLTYGLEGGIHFPIKVDDILFLDGLLEGKHVLSLIAEDMAGNTYEDCVTFFIDTTPPNLEIIYPLNDDVTNSSKITVSIDHNDSLSGVSSIMVTLNGDELDPIQPSKDIVIEELKEGLNRIGIAVMDLSGNKVIEYLNIFLDTVPPNIIDFGPVNGDIPINSTIFARFSERMDQTTVRFHITDNVGFLFWSGNLAILNPDIPIMYDTVYRVTVIGKDHAGNGMLPFNWEFKTTDKGSVMGFVLNDVRVPIEGAKISIHDNLSFMTGADGGFEVNISSGRYNLVVSADGFSPQNIDFVISPGQLLDLGVIILKNKEILGQVRGRVIDIDGLPLLGAVITAGSSEMETTGEDGIFFVQLAPGENILYISREGYHNASVRVIIIEDETTIMDDIILVPIDDTAKDKGSLIYTSIMIIFVLVLIVGSSLLYFMYRTRKRNIPPSEE